MKVICSWCQLDMGECEPLDQKTITHGICQACAKKMEAQLDEIEERDKKKGTPKGQS